tara:strand:- start:1317 stop:2078 length:762 start_codon:yes stop_codon:yes gene_type:complete
MNKEIYVFDFDGVVCDSTYECLVTSWNAWSSFFELNKFRSKISEFSTEEISKFKFLRYYVRGAGEYYVLRKILFEDKISQIKSFKDFNVWVNKYENEIEAFKPFMFSSRKTLRKSSLDAWINLHEVYKEVIDIIKKSVKKENIYIATLKDLESVKLILQMQGINFPSKKIYHQEHIKTKIEALMKIADIEEKDPSDILFFDDVVNHLIEPYDHGFSAYQTSWGNVPIDYIIEAKSKSIPIADLDTLASLCSTN